MAFPSSCSLRIKGIDCNIPPAYIIIIKTKNDEEFMIGVACEEHKEILYNHTKKMQETNTLVQGRIEFQNIKIVTTDCVKGGENDLEDVIFRRQTNSKLG